MELNNLQLDGVSYRVGPKRIIQSITASLPTRQVIGLVGPNGAGKSTLLRMMAGVLRPTSGAVRLNGEAVHRIPDRQRAQTIALMPQNPGIGFGFRVEEVVAMGRYPYVPRLSPLTEACHRVIQQAMEATDIRHFAHRTTPTLSGGERQRVFLARALAQEPQLLLLDEPTASLDVKYQLEILEIVRTLRQEKEISVVLAIHDLSMALRYCDHLIFLKDGTLAAAGPAAAVCTEEMIKEVFGVQARLRTSDDGLPRIDILSLG